MTNEHKSSALSAEQIHVLALEADVSDRDIRMIIDLVGTDRSSIVREARILKKSR